MVAMMTVEIPKKELLRQLPQMAGYALIQWLDEMPDRFVFEATPILSREEEIEKAHPEVHPLLTPKEWSLFVSLYKRGKVTRSWLHAELGLLEDQTFIPESNMLDVHIKNLRKKLMHETRFRIVTYRAGFNIQGRFALKELK